MGARSRTGKSTKTATKAKAVSLKEAKAAEPDRSLWQKTFDREAELTPEEALLAVHWIRQITGLTTGTLLGAFQATGFPAILSFLVISAVFPSLLLSVWHELDLEEIAKVNSVQTEGFMPSFALFMLSWIISYTVFLPPSP